MHLLQPRCVKFVSWLGLAVVALLGVFGFGHQYDLSLTQTDCRALLEVVGRAIREDFSPYQRASVESLSAVLRFPVDELFYPPSFIALAAPFTLSGEAFSRVLILVAQVLCFGYVISRSAKEIPARHQAWVWLSPVAFLALFQTARFGQLSCFACAAVLCFWDRWRAGRMDLVAALLLFVATVKPSISLALLVFLLLERSFALLFVVALMHVGAGWIASQLSGVALWSLSTEWLSSLASYRELPQNSPTGSFVYGLSTLVHRFTDTQYSFDWLALPLSYAVWRMKNLFTQHECIALLLLISFVVGAPHAYDFLLLLPALWSVCGRAMPAGDGDRALSWGTGMCILVSVMLLLPQRVLLSAGFTSFDSILRVSAPLVLGIALVAGRRSPRQSRSNEYVLQLYSRLREWVQWHSVGTRAPHDKAS